MRRLHEAGDANSLAWVVMPDHVHWLVRLNRMPLNELSVRMKACSALGINRHRGTEGRIWQKGFHDRALRRDDDLQAAARYVIANPLRAGLVRRIGDYPLWDAVWL
jgi:REP element-mobilizing transposase RayT